MDKRITGFAIMLLSLILMLGFQSCGWYYAGDASLKWSMIWMLTAIVGFVLVVWKEKPDDK